MADSQKPQQQARGTVVWFDLPVADLDRAIRFYGAVLAAPIHKHEFPGGALGVFPHEGTAIGGCLVASGKAQPSASGPLVYLDCSGRLDAAVAEAQQHGGTVLEPKTSMAPHGWRAVILDCEGNRVALHSR